MDVIGFAAHAPAVTWWETLQRLDLALLMAAREIPPWSIFLFYVFTVIGAGWGMIALVPFLIKAATRRATIALFGALAATSGTVNTIKQLVGRTRPCDALEWCTPLHSDSPGGWSFPSGHAAGSFAFAIFVTLVTPRFAPLALVYAFLVAWSRCVIGVHYPSDVLAGSILGGLIGGAFATALRYHDRRRRTSDPAQARPAEDAPASLTAGASAGNRVASD